MQRSLTKSQSLIPSVQEPENVPDVEDKKEQALHNELLFKDGSDYNESNPVSLTKDEPNMKAWEEMRAPEDELILSPGSLKRAGEGYRGRFVPRGLVFAAFGLTF